MSAGRLAAAALACLALAPASASATVNVTNTSDPTRIELAGDSADDLVSLIYDSLADEYYINGQAGTEITTSSGTCTSFPPSSVVCPGAGVTTFTATLGGGDDSVLFDAAMPSTVRTFINGENGHDTVTGDDGREIFRGGRGQDVIVGGGGIDTFSYADHRQAVTARIGGPMTSGNATDGATIRDQIGGDVENLIGSRGNDVLIGNFAANRITGVAGNDRITGRRGADVLLGAGGNDRLFAKDLVADVRIDCGAGPNRLERATRDSVDPPAQNC